MDKQQVQQFLSQLAINANKLSAMVNQSAINNEVGKDWGQTNNQRKLKIMRDDIKKLNGIIDAIAFQLFQIK